MNRIKQVRTLSKMRVNTRMKCDVNITKKYMVASCTSVLTILGREIATATEFKPALRPNPIITAKAAKSETIENQKAHIAWRRG